MTHERLRRRTACVPLGRGRVERDRVHANGWWRDRAVAVRRLVADRDHFAEQTGDRVTVMLDAGEPPPAEDAEGARSLRRQLGAS